MYMSFKEDAISVLQEGQDEIRSASLAQRVSLGAMACSLAFEWGTGNEALIGMVGGAVFQHTHEALLTAAATGAASFGEQSIFGITAAVAVANFPRATKAIREKFFSGVSAPRQEEVEHTDENMQMPEESYRSKIAATMGRFATVFALGTAVPTIVRNAAHERSFSENTKDVLKDATLIGLGVVAIAGAAAGATNMGDALGIHQQSEVVVNVLTNPATYAGLFGLKTAWSIVKQRFTKHKRQANMSEQEESNMASEQELLRAPDGSLRVVVSEEVSRNDRDQIWEMVRDGFVTLNSRSAEHQDPTRAELEADMESKDVLKYVAYDQNDKPVGFMTAHVGLEGITWVDESIKAKMAEQQAKTDPKGRPAYVGTLVVPEDLRATEVTPALVRSALLHWHNQINDSNEHFLCFFDCAQANYPGLPLLIKRLARPTQDYAGVPIDIEEIGQVSVTIPSDRQFGENDMAHVDPSSSGLEEQKITDTQHFFSISIK